MMQVNLFLLQFWVQDNFLKRKLNEEEAAQSQIIIQENQKADAHDINIMMNLPTYDNPDVNVNMNFKK